MDFNATDAEQQRKEIEKIVNQQPLIGFDLVKGGLEALNDEFEGTPNFKRKLPGLKEKFGGLRRVRGDGNCFFRGFMFRLLEVLKDNEVERSRVLSIIKESSTWLEGIGFDSISIEMFYDQAVEIFQNLTPNLQDLLSTFSEQGDSEYLVWYSRLLSAGYLKANASRFEPFIPTEFNDVHEFCSKEVLPMGKECEQPQIIALSEFLGVKVVIAYLDASDSNEATIHTFGDATSSVEVSLLYRPGHYDILIR